MAITFRHIIDKTMFYLRKEAKFFSSSEVYSIIQNDAFRRVAEDIDYPRTSYSAVLSSGEYIVSAPSDFIKFDQNWEPTFEDSASTRDLKPSTDISRSTILTATPGTPSSYGEWSEKQIFIHPPSTSGTIVIPYVKQPTVLSSDTDTNELTEDCYMAAIYWTVKDCMDKDNDARFQVWEARYNAETQRLRKRFNEKFEVSYNIAPERDYLRESN